MEKTIEDGEPGQSGSGSAQFSCWRARVRKLSMLLSLLIAAPFLANPAMADVALELNEGIRIETPMASPAAAGGRTKLVFRIENGSGVDLYLLGVSTPVAPNAELIASLGGGKETRIEGIGIPAGEVLDLTTTHLRYVLYPLVTELRSGQEFSAVLRFVEGDVPITVHVHGTAGEPRLVRLHLQDGNRKPAGGG